MTIREPIHTLTFRRNQACEKGQDDLFSEWSRVEFRNITVSQDVRKMPTRRLGLVILLTICEDVSDCDGVCRHASIFLMPH